MARPVVFTNRNKDVLIDIEWSGETLRKDIHNVVVTIGTIIEFDAKGVLPFLGLQNVFRVRGVKKEALKIKLTDTAKLRPRLEVHIRVVADAVGAFEKTNLGIEIRTDLAMLAKDFEPAILIIHPSPKVCLPRRDSWRSRLRCIAGQHQVLMEDQASVCTACLVEAIAWISGALIDSHYTDVGTAPQRTFHTGYRVVGVRVWTATSSLHVHCAQFETIDRPGDLTSAIDRDFFAGDRINTNVATEEEKIPAVASEWKIEDAGILQKELTLFWEEKLVGREVELQSINIGIGEVGINGEVGY